jgi:diguanylate cyclase (GGDEF)-like protein
MRDSHYLKVMAPFGLPFAWLLLSLLLLCLGLAVGLVLMRLLNRPLMRLVNTMNGLTAEQLAEPPPNIRDRRAQTALNQVWTLNHGLSIRQRELIAQNTAWQRRHGQARALIDLMAEFNQVMQLGAVLDRLSQGLSRFFAGDGVAIWIRATRGDLELAARVADAFPASLHPSDRWVEHVLGDHPGPMPPPWVGEEQPSMAAPLFDAQGQKIGIVALTSRLRTAYTVEDVAFLRTVIGHAAMAIQNATMYELVDALSRIDALTGLHNRREFDRLLAQEVSRAQNWRLPVSLLLVDIDHFKQINDDRGHQEGDRALREFARLIQLVPKTARDAAFRTGGEEFAVLLGEVDKAGALAAAESLRAVTERFKFLDEGTQLTVSVGVATFPEDGQDPVTLVRAADRALYQAKAAGRNRSQAA